MHPNDEQGVIGALVALGLTGLLAGLGVLLASKEVLTLRIVIGRSLSSCALGIASTAILIPFPDLPLYVQIGIACILASLGTSTLERAFQWWTRR